MLNNKGQSLLEYSLVGIGIAMVAVAMSTYVFRSIQATEKQVEVEFAQE